MSPQFKRTLGMVMVIVAVVSLVISVGGMLVIWSARGSVTSALQRTLTLASDTLATSEKALSVADQGLADAGNAVTALTGSTGSIATSIGSAQDKLKSVTQVVKADLPTSVNSALDALQSAKATASDMDAFLTDLNSLPQLKVTYEPQVPLDESIGQLSDSLAGLPPALAKLGDALEGASSNLPGVINSVESLGTTIGAINSTVGNGRAVIGEYSIQLARAKAGIDVINTSVPYYMTPLMLGLLFQWLWVAVVQVIVLAIGWRWWRKTEDELLYVVQGTVRDSNNQPVASVTVEAYDHDAQKEDKLGSVKTDTVGHYEIRYKREQFASRKNAKLDLIVRALDDKGQKLAESPILNDAHRDQTVDLTVAVPVQPEKPPFVVRGTVRDSKGLPQTAALVGAFDHQSDNDKPLGNGATDIEGHYEIRYRREQFATEKTGADLVVRVWNNHGQQVAESSILPNARQEETIDLTVSAPIQPVDDPTFVVRGTVRDQFGDLLDGVTVQAFDCDLRNQELVGSDTAKAGHYEIRYESSQFRRAEKGAADLVVKVLDLDAVELYKSPLQYNAPEVLEFNIILDEAEYKGRSEFEVLTDIFMPLLEGLSPLDLREDKDHHDISFLSGETGQTQQSTITWVLCLHLADRSTRDQTPLEADVFFAFLRQGQPSIYYDTILQEMQSPDRKILAEDKILQALSGISPDSQQALLEQALVANLVPARMKTRIEKVLDTLHQIKLHYAADNHFGGGKGTISQLLELIPAAKDQQTAFMTAFMAHSGPLNAFWKQIADDEVLPPEVVQQVKVTFEIGALTDNHIPLVSELVDRLQSGDLKAKRDLARYDRADWIAVFNRPGRDGQPIGVPANIDGNTPDAKLEMYAAKLDRQFERAYPTTSFGAKLKRSQAVTIAAKPDVVLFLENNPDFQLDRFRLDRYIAEHDGALGGIADTEALLTDLKSIQRVFRLQPTYRAVEALLSRQIDSAQRIYFMGPEQFVRAIDKDKSSINTIEARQIYRKAETAYAMALAVFGEYNQAVNGLIPHALPDMKPEGDTQLTIAALPDLKALFGSLDYCECTQCRSVYSPAAYFVDIMRFLGERGKDGVPSIDSKASALHVLLERRPDLGEIELSCENTNTPLPYIDLVNEILEDVVVAPLTPVTLNSTIEDDLVAGTIKQSVLNELTAKSITIGADALVYAPDFKLQWVVRDAQHAYKIFKTGGELCILPTRQTFLSAAELRANPEYTNVDAYNKLQQEVFPLSLPFDLWQIQTRSYLSHLGVPQPRLLELFQQEPSDCAWLGITESERQILTDAREDKQPWDFWGLAEIDNSLPNPDDPASETIIGSWITVLSNVNVMLNRSGLAYRELLQLLDMWYVNPEGPVKIFDGADSNAVNCDTSKFEIRNLDEGTLNRMQSFIRLWRKLGCAMWELDILLGYPEAFITDDTLQTISQMSRLREQTGLDWRIIYSLYKDIDHDHNLYVNRAEEGAPAVQTLYQRLFRNKLVDAVSSFPASPSQIAGSIESYVPGILAAFRIRESDLNLIVSDLRLSAASALDVQVLSKIYRITVLAHALSLNVESFLRLKRLWARDPFEDPVSTRKFLDLAEQVADSKFSVQELDYLLTHQFTPNSGVALEDKTLVNIMRAIRDGLQKIRDDIQRTAEETRTDYVKSKLGLLPALRKDADQVVALSIIDGTWQATAAHPSTEREALIGTVFVGALGLAAAKTNLAVLAAGLSPADRQAAVDQRFEYVQSALELFLLKNQTEVFIVQKIAEAMQLDMPSSSALLRSLHLSADTNTLLQCITDPRLLDRQPDGNYILELDEANFPAIFKALRLLHKDALMLNKLQIKADELFWWLAGDHATGMGWMHPGDFPIDASTSVAIQQWRAIQQFFVWKDALPKSNLTAFEFATNVLNSAKSAAENIADLAQLTAWSIDDIQALAVAFNWADPDGIKQELRKSVNLVRLTDCKQALRRLGVNAAQAIQWATVEPTAATVDALKQAIKAKYDLPQWQQIIQPLQDGFREQKRQALVSWLVAHPDQSQDQKWLDANGLYSYFLIDVEMDACMLTSRLKQAAASAQLFVQRCLLNLEADILASTDLDSKWKQWNWMKRYRVWEANRKVFLYPENWIEPELRDEKSPFFKDLENELMQNDITNETAEQAYLNYLEKLDHVANLEVRAIYNETGQYESTLHVFGRTRSSQSPAYYYRRRINGQRWLAWEKVDPEINANLLTPIVFNQRLYLFWPQFLDKADSPGEVPIPRLDQSTATIIPPAKYWEVRLFWSELKHGKWTPKVLSDKFITLHQTDAQYQDLALRVNIAPNIIVQLFGSSSARQFAPSNQFDFSVIGKQIDAGRPKDWLLSSNESVETSSATAQSGYTLQTEKRSTNLTLQPWYMLLPSNSQVRDGLIMNYAASVYYNYSFKPLESAKSTYNFTITAIPNYFQGTKAFRVNAWNTEWWPSETEMPANWPFDAIKTNLLIEKNSEIHVVAKLGAGVTGLKFRSDAYGGIGPEGDGGLADIKCPIPGTRGGHSFALYAKLGGKYYEIGRENTFTAEYEGPLMFLFNDTDAANEGWVNVTVTVHRPSPGSSSSPASFVVFSDSNDKQTAQPSATDSANSALLLQAGLPDSYTVVDSYAKPSDPARDDQFFFWDKYRTYFVEYHGDMSTTYSSGTYSSGTAQSQLNASFRFNIHYHPFVELFMKELNIRGLKGLLNRRIQIDPASVPGRPNLFNFASYLPAAGVVKNYKLPDKTNTYPVEDVDFSYTGAYSPYNWELFFHVPFFIANKLSTNQRFEEALQWYHYVFDPTNHDNAILDPKKPQKRFWITKPFYETTKDDYNSQKIENILKAIADGNSELRAQVEAWRDNPFNPHLIARMRIVAYQKNVLIKYIQTLIAWGDQLFRQDTIETINEATQLYILADTMLGPRPKSIPRQVANPIKTFYQLQQEHIDNFGNALKKIENLLPEVSSSGKSDPDTPELPRLLYFCIPHNDKLLTMWDTVADRMFKIRHCMNIEGLVRQLPLYEPPIDPALLVKAAAAGLDIGAVLNDMNAPIPLYRFSFMIQRALEICNEVKALGTAMLSALEKRDAEAFALLRSSHELLMLDLVGIVKNSQVTEALHNKESLEESKKVIEKRQAYYEKLMRDGLSGWETASLTLSGIAIVAEAVAVVANTISAGTSMIPQVTAGVSGFGGTPHMTLTIGGEQVSRGLSQTAAIASGTARIAEIGAGMTSTIGSYNRRAVDWDFQKGLADKEFDQITKQIDAADIRHQIAIQEVTNHNKQIENIQSEDEYMHAKFTNQELFDWMINQISTVYFQSYQLAYDIAKRAERCFRYELGLSDSSYIQFGYWDSLRKGLLSGEKLFYDLKRLEAAYYEQNRREYELAKHISLAQLDPIALLKLRQNGECFVDIPETAFDMDFPGHYFRRIKTVSLSIPCVAGPYTTVGCTLTLASNHLRKDSILLGDKYVRDLNVDDSRFRDEIAAIQSIATSSAQSDDGLFELNFRDERYLPFEGAGAISTWHIKLNKDLPQFDFSTISDVIIHLNYTAREGGELLRSKAVEEVNKKLSELALAENRRGLFRIFDLKSEYSSKWYKFLHPANSAADQELVLDDLTDRLPYFTRHFTTKQVRQIEVVALLRDVKGTPTKEDTAIYKVMLSPLGNQPADLLTLSPDPTYQGLHRAFKDLTGSEIDFGAWTLKLQLDGAPDFTSLPADAIQELFLILNYTVT